MSRSNKTLKAKLHCFVKIRFKNFSRDIIMIIKRMISQKSQKCKRRIKLETLLKKALKSQPIKLQCAKVQMPILLRSKINKTIKNCLNIVFMILKVAEMAIGTLQAPKIKTDHILRSYLHLKKVE